MNPKARRVGAKSSVVAARAKTAIQKKQRDGVPAEAIEAWAVDCLVALNVSKKDAQQIAASLVQTSLWGIDSHGVARLGHYYSRLEAGSIEPRPKIRIRRTGPCTAQVDGGNGHGIVICHRAMDEAIALARKSGVGAVGVSNSTHCGAAGLYGRQAARAGSIGIAFKYSDAFVAPHRGTKKFSAWKIHTEINQGGDHRVHGAPTQRKQEATRCWQQFMRVDAI